MNYAGRLSISYYQTVAALSEEHRVYLVQHRETGKIYVKKVLTVYNPAVYEALRRLAIPGIPHLQEIYEEDSTLTVIEDYISGDSLSDLIEGNHLTLPAIHRVMQDLCSIFEQLHAQSPAIIHRDVKPSNIIIDHYGHAVLLDFNAAKFENTAADPDKNTDTVLLGTAGYAAPEQYGFGSSTIQTDVYALGILLREMTDSLPEADRLPALYELADRCTKMDPAERIVNTKALGNYLRSIEAGDAIQSAHLSASRRRFLPPGFRTHTPWKMLLSLPTYLFIVWLSLSLEFEYPSVQLVWGHRILVLIWAMAIILYTCNYCDVQRWNPLSGNENPLLRMAGTLLVDVLLSLAFLFIMALSIS